MFTRKIFTTIVEKKKKKKDKRAKKSFFSKPTFKIFTQASSENLFSLNFFSKLLKILLTFFPEVSLFEMPVLWNVRMINNKKLIYPRAHNRKGKFLRS